MLLSQSFEKNGNWLFRWRSYLPLLLIGLFVVSLPSYRYPANSKGLDYFWEFFCLGISLLGLGIRIYTIGHTPKGTSGRNTKLQVADSLNTTGIYSMVRNPLYLGNFFAVLGIAMFPCLWWLAVIYVLVFWLYYERIIAAEEAYLHAKFGPIYLDWAQRTPAFIPSLRHYRPATLPFSLRMVLRREYNGLFAIGAIFFALEVSTDFVADHKLEADPVWGTVLAGTFVIWLVLRSLKKGTTLLNVEGRQ